MVDMPRSRLAPLRRFARLALSAALLGMGALHFEPEAKKTMARMVPTEFTGGRPRAAVQLVEFTGRCEIAAAVGLQVPLVRRLTGDALILFLACVFPANARAAKHPEEFGRLAMPLYPRLAAQVALAFLVRFATVRGGRRRR